MFRILEVPDLHLYDKEIGSSINYPEQSIKILDDIIDIYRNGDYDVVILGGDVQHGKLEKIKYISEFQRKLSLLGSLVKERLQDKNIKMSLYDMNDNLIDNSDYVSWLISVRGQHDNGREDFTFFDMLLENKILLNPRYIIIENTQINIINYCNRIEDLIEHKRDRVENVIGVYHNAILENGVFLDDIIGKTISPSKNLLFKETDLAIINDIHAQVNPYDVITDGHKTLVITPGSLGRTSFNKSNNRDSGNLVSVKVDNTDIQVGVIKLDLIPAKQFFSEKAIERKIKENAFKNFFITLQNLEISYFDIKQEIMKEVSDPVIRDLAIKIVEDVE